MALNRSVADVIKVFGDKAMSHQELIGALCRCRLMWNQFTHGTLVHQGWYFAIVPSQNFMRGHHQVLIHYDFDNGLTVLDPAIGNRYDENGRDLVSWAQLIAFMPGGALPEL